MKRRKTPKSKSAKPTERPLDPLFLKDRVTPEVIHKTVTGTKSDESVSILLRAIRDAEQKIGWAKAQLEDKSLALEEREFYEARGRSGRAVSEGVLLHLPEHQEGAAQAKRARRKRTSALRALIEDFLRLNPTGIEIDVLRHLSCCIGRGVIETVTEDVIEWTNKDGRARTTSITALKDLVSRSRAKQ